MNMGFETYLGDALAWLLSILSTQKKALQEALLRSSPATSLLGRPEAGGMEKPEEAWRWFLIFSLSWDEG